MKRLIFILFIIPLFAFPQPRKKIVWDELTKNTKCELRMETDSSFVMDDMPFHVKFQHKGLVKPKYTYEQDGKSIAFIPVGMKWDKSETASLSNQSKGEKNNKQSVIYKDIFIDNISIKNEITKKGWKKIVVIDSLSCLGEIPETANYLEIIFEIQTDFTFTNANKKVWDKKTNFFFTDNVTLTTDSRIRPIRVWNADTLINCQGLIYAYGNKQYLMKKIPVSLLKSMNYPIYNDVEISYGDEYVFNTSGPSYNNAVCILSPSLCVVAYKDGGNSNYATCVAGSISGTTITFGSEYVAYSGNSDYGSVAAMTDTTFITTYAKSGVLYCRHGTVSGTTIAYGTEKFLDVSSDWSGTAKLTSTTFVIATNKYTSDPDQGYVGVLTLSGSTVSGDINYLFNNSSGKVGYFDIESLTSSTFIIVWQDGGDSNHGKSRIGTVSGNVISFGSIYEFNTAITNKSTIGVLSSSSFVIGFTDADNSNYGTTIIGTVSGTVISYGSKYVYSSATTYYNNIAVLSESEFIIEYYVVPDGGKAIYGSISSGEITFNDAISTSSYGGSNGSVSTISSSAFIVAYLDNGNSNRGTAIIGTIPAPVTGVKWNGTTISKLNGVAVTKINGL